MHRAHISYARVLNAASHRDVITYRRDTEKKRISFYTLLFFIIIVSAQQHRPLHPGCALIVDALHQSSIPVASLAHESDGSLFMASAI